MNIEVAMILSGLLFWFIIITNIASGKFGYSTINELGPEAKLQKIIEDPKQFRIGVVLIIVEHISIIALAATLFIAFNSYNLILGIIWLISRTAEGLIQIYYKKNYWRLLNLATQYSSASGAEKDALIDSSRNILKTKSSSFSFAQVLFSIGTIAYSILFVAYGVVPVIIGWSGIVAGVFYGLGNGLTPVMPKFKAILNLGALLVLLFEVVLGGWLLFVHSAS